MIKKDLDFLWRKLCGVCARVPLAGKLAEAQCNRVNKQLMTLMFMHTIPKHLIDDRQLAALVPFCATIFRFCFRFYDIRPQHSLDAVVFVLSSRRSAEEGEQAPVRRTVSYVTACKHAFRADYAVYLNEYRAM